MNVNDSHTDRKKGSYNNKVTNKNGKKYCNGIDVTDQTRTFSPDEWKKLPYSFKKELFNNSERRAKKPKRDTSSASTTGTESTSASSATDDTISRIVSGVMRAQLAHGDQVRPPVAQPRMGAGGATSRQAAGVDSGSIVGSVITENTRWDHNGNRM